MASPTTLAAFLLLSSLAVVLSRDLQKRISIEQVADGCRLGKTARYVCCFECSTCAENGVKTPSCRGRRLVEENADKREGKDYWGEEKREGKDYWGEEKREEKDYWGEAKREDQNNMEGKREGKDYWGEAKREGKDYWGEEKREEKDYWGEAKREVKEDMEGKREGKDYWGEAKREGKDYWGEEKREGKDYWGEAKREEKDYWGKRDDKDDIEAREVLEYFLAKRAPRCRVKVFEGVHRCCARRNGCACPKDVVARCA